MGTFRKKTFWLQYFLVLNYLVFNNYAVGKINTQLAIVEPHTETTTGFGFNRLSIGVVFDHSTAEIQRMFKFAIFQNISNITLDYFNFDVYVNVINTADFFKLSRLVCDQFSRGVIGIIAGVIPDSLKAFESYANTFHVPLVSTFFPEKDSSEEFGSDLPNYALSILPDYHEAIMGTVWYYGWKHVIYFYDSPEGLLRLQQIYKSLIPGKKSYFRIASAKKVTSSKDVILFLRQLEKIDRWTNKYIILDCSTALARDTIVNHVRDVKLGRKNYHYLLTGLVLEVPWALNVTEYSILNITGFKMVDTSRTFVKRLYDLLQTESLMASSALMYDAIYTLLAAFNHINKHKPYILENLLKKDNRSRFLKCDTENPVALKYGKEILEALRETKIEGITGNISFSSKGKRQNFSLMVIHSNMKDGIAKIATWYDDKGFKAVRKIRNKLDATGRYYRNKTYTVLSIQEAPYFMANKPKKIFMTDPDIVYSGFCVDLAKLIAEKLEINIQFSMVADGKYGDPEPAAMGGWDGMVGELVRKEVDMVIAPLMVTKEREAAIDFSMPFLSFHRIQSKSLQEGKLLPFRFLKPLSSEVWYLILGSFLLVSIVSCVITRLTSAELRALDIEDTDQPSNGREAQTGCFNNFNFFDTIWNTLSTKTHRKSGTVLKSASIRVLCLTWWLFVLIIACTYTAYLSSELTLASLALAAQNGYSRVAKCPEDMRPELTREVTVNNELHGDGDTMEHAIPPNEHGYPYVKSTSNCEMLVTVSKSGIMDFSVAFPKGSKLRTGVNLALIAMKEDRTIFKLEKKYFYNSVCGTLEPPIGAKEITLKETAGIFYFLLGGLGLSLAILIYQIVFSHYCNNIRASRRKASRATSRQDLNEPINAIRSRDDLDIEATSDGTDDVPTSYSRALCCEMAAPLQTVEERGDLRTRTTKIRNQKSRLQLPVINELQMIELGQRSKNRSHVDDSDSLGTSFELSPSQSPINVMIRPRQEMYRPRSPEAMQPVQDAREIDEAPEPYFTSSRQTPSTFDRYEL